MKKYKIIERRGIFIVFYSYESFSFLKLKTVEKWNVAYIGINRPAHFKTLKDAKKWVKKITKPDVEHLID